jgi:uncharacterized DUF497 family protein
MAACEFEWDEAKSASDLRKHGVTFDEAMAIFADPLLLTIADPDHDGVEERWVSVGENDKGRLILAVHTFVEREIQNVVIRLISARRPTKNEARQYREGY